ncbi:uncharacterized protein LOC120281826 [Dioscorea cayenensis subsp. rotundata]|uniref:GPI inositol-deacylase n=1 Tax=Dioscorea cayennensis subsp. rotundata TaxID=55577 RepID=A0AB40D2K1_DIOCR|nr:uncharacterized protein LOC120281826 [Dioscorea cayenensis subsp. rotundata]
MGNGIVSVLPSPCPSSLPGAVAGTSISTATTRPAVILPGLGNNTGDYHRLVSTLREAHGIPSVVAKVSRVDWLRNAAGVLDRNYWKGTLRPRPVLDWYLERVDQAVSEAKMLCRQGERISLIGHSAGGWLARVYMQEFGTANVALLLTLGTPHLPPSKGSPGVFDQTRGLLDYVEKYCSPALYTPELRYVCIAGRYIQGAHFGGDDKIISNEVGKLGGTFELAMDSGNQPPLAGPTLRARFIGQGYKQVCGRAEVWGDGVVPEISAHLEGALNISLEGVYHSPVGSDDESRPWYGSPAIVEKWVHHLLA